MNPDKPKLWQAYLDGELSTSEITAFEGTLSPDERDQLAAEVLLERGIGERLSQGAECPEHLWRRVKNEIAGRSGFGRRYRRVLWGSASLAAAASIAFVAAIYGPGLLRYAPGIPEGSSAVVMAAETIEELQATSTVDPDRDSVQAFLDDHHVDLRLLEKANDLPMAAIHHDIIIVGAREITVNGDKTLELLFGCCGRPVKLILAKQGTRAAEIIGAAASKNGQVQNTRHVGDYFTAVVGGHRAHGLLDIFAGQRGL